MFESRHHKRISLKCEALESRFPVELLNLWDLTELEIIGGNFTYFPEDISILKKLKKLTLVSTKISVIPKEVFQLPELVSLNLKNNRLQELPVLTERSSIKEMILGRNYLSTKALEPFFYHFPFLHYLDLGHNNLEAIPESLFHLKRLTRLNLESNRLHTLPVKLEELNELTHLSVTDNPFACEEKRRIEKKFNIFFS